MNEIVEWEGIAPDSAGRLTQYHVTVYPVVAEEMGGQEVVAKYLAQFGPQAGTWRRVRNPVALARLKKIAILAKESERSLL